MIFNIVFITFIVVFILTEITQPIFCFLFSPSINFNKKFKPNITVIIPSRDEGTIIERTIKSWLKVGFPDKFEILMVDDSKHDQTKQIIRKYAKKFNFIKYIKGEGISKIAALEQGIKKAKYPVIAISDADVIVTKICMKELVPYMWDKKVGAVFGKRIPSYDSLFRIFEAMRLYFLQVKQTFYTNMDSAPFAFMSPSLFRKKDLLKIKFVKDLIADDFFIGIKLRQLGLKVVFLPNVKGGFVGSLNNFKEILIRDLRSFEGTASISLTNYYHSMFNKKYGVFGMFSVPFRQLEYIGRAFIFGLLLVALVVDLFLGSFTLSYVLFVLALTYCVFFVTTFVNLIGVFFKLKYFDFKFLLVLILYPFYQLIKELNFSLSFHSYIFGRKAEWKKTVSDRV